MTFFRDGRDVNTPHRKVCCDCLNSINISPILLTNTDDNKHLLTVRKKCSNESHEQQIAATVTQLGPHGRSWKVCGWIPTPAAYMLRHPLAKSWTPGCLVLWKWLKLLVEQTACAGQPLPSVCDWHMWLENRATHQLEEVYWELLGH